MRLTSCALIFLVVLSVLSTTEISGQEQLVKLKVNWLQQPVKNRPLLLAASSSDPLGFGTAIQNSFSSLGYYLPVGATGSELLESVMAKYGGNGVYLISASYRGRADTGCGGHVPYSLNGQILSGEGVVANFTFSQGGFGGKCMERITNDLARRVIRHLALSKDIQQNGPPVIVDYADSELTGLDNDSILAIIDASDGSPYRGLYRSAPGSHKSCGSYQFAVIDFQGGLKAVINKEVAREDALEPFRVGEVKASFTRTASPTLFIADWKKSTRQSAEGFAEFDGGILTFDFASGSEGAENISCNYIKTYPFLDESPAKGVGGDAVGADVRGAISAGSAVVIDGINKYVVTNYHVVDGGSAYAVEQEGVLYDAILLKTDEKNDLALLRITEDGVTLKAIPISMDDKLGDRVYSAGYPRVFQMGDDIKITEGVLSSMSFLADPSRYQTSVPITNGNSGGALLDETGNLVGITQGGWRPDVNTENVNAAVKSLYVVSLAQTEASCNPSFTQQDGAVDFSEIERSVLPLFVYE